MGKKEESKSIPQSQENLKSGAPAVGRATKGRFLKKTKP